MSTPVHGHLNATFVIGALVNKLIWRIICYFTQVCVIIPQFSWNFFFNFFSLSLFLGDKPFSCDICQKKFALSCNLRAHLKTHEAEYQTSAASLALYKRALAALGSPQTSPVNGSAPGSPEDLIEEDHEEDHEVDSNHSSSPKMHSSMDYSTSRLTVTV